MGVKQTGKVCAAIIGAVLVQLGVPGLAMANWGTPGCGVVPLAASGAFEPQQAARSGEIPGLGRVAASIEWDGRQQLTLAGGGFSVTRAFTPWTREVEISISGSGDEDVIVRLGGADGVVVTKGTTVARGLADPDALRALVNGRAVTAFRERVGNYERHLISGSRRARVDDAHADGFLLAGAFLASLAGDPTAVGRARDLVTRRVRGRVRAVGFEFKDCVRDYEQYLLMIDEQRTSCLEAANGRETWYARAADRLGCEAEFIAGALAGEGQFISCTALGSIVT